MHYDASGSGEHHARFDMSVDLQLCAANIQLCALTLGITLVEARIKKKLLSWFK